MTSDRPTRDTLRGLPSTPAAALQPSDPFAGRERHESGELLLPSPRALVHPEFGQITPPRFRDRDQVEAELQRIAPHHLRKVEMTPDQIAKRRAVASLEDGVQNADSLRRFTKLAGLKSDKSVREWIEIEQRSVPFHLVFRIPDELSFVMLSHVVGHWGRGALLRMRALCDKLLGESESEDGPAWRAM